MVKGMKKSIAVLLAVFLLLGLVACGGSGGGGGEAAFVGEWKLEYMDAGGTKTMGSDMEALGVSLYANISADKKIVIDILVEQEGTWALKDDYTITLTFPEDSLVPADTMKLDGGKLILEIPVDGGTMVYCFTK